MTQIGEKIFGDLSVHHLAELQLVGHALVRELKTLFTGATHVDDRCNEATDVERAERLQKMGKQFYPLEQERT